MYRFQNYFLTSSCFAASFNSLTNLSTSVLCIMQARFISSVPKEGQSKQPFPKYFVKTAFVAGYFFVTSPVLIFFVMRISLPIISLLIKNAKMVKLLIENFPSSFVWPMTHAVLLLKQAPQRIFLHSTPQDYLTPARVDS